MDKMTIIGKDGKELYELTEDNDIVDLRDRCTCHIEGRPEMLDDGNRVCLLCKLKIV